MRASWRWDYFCRDAIRICTVVVLQKADTKTTIRPLFCPVPVSGNSFNRWMEYYCLLWINKAKAKDKMYMSVGVMKDYKLN